MALYLTRDPLDIEGGLNLYRYEGTLTIMELSVRHRFGNKVGCDVIKVFSGSWTWGNYLAWVKLKHLDQVKTYDTILNPVIANNIFVLSDIQAVKLKLPLLCVNHTYQYLQLAINMEEEKMPLLPDWARLLGYDLVESGYAISSLLNCGPWEGKLAHFAATLNEVGLLDLEEIRRAKMMLPAVWGDDEPHAFTDVWAICEVTPSCTIE